MESTPLTDSRDSYKIKLLHQKCGRTKIQPALTQDQSGPGSAATAHAGAPHRGGLARWPLRFF